MGVSSVALDGQNVGFTLDGGTTQVDLFTVTFDPIALTAAVTSAYLSDAQCRIVEKSIAEVSKLVPLPSIGAASPGVWQRIVAVVPADNNTVSCAIVGTPNPFVAIYRATASASPAFIVLHVPYSMDGLLAWAGAGGAASATSLYMKGPAAPVTKPPGGTAGVQWEARNLPADTAWTAGAGYFWVEQLDGAFGDLAIAATVGIIAYNRWSTEGRALIFTNASGQATVTFTQTAGMPAAATFHVAAGPGPGAAWPNLGILAGSVPVEIAYS
jgi:hypothetical protein